MIKRFEYNHVDGFQPYIYDVEDNHMIDDLKIICELLNQLNDEYENKKVILEDDVNYYKVKSGSCEEELLYLRNENKQLQKRNDNQKEQLEKLWGLIEEKDWDTLTGMVKEIEKCEELLQKEWKCYSNV